jgi:hypothetical protein
VDHDVVGGEEGVAGQAAQRRAGTDFLNLHFGRKLFGQTFII